VLSCAWREEKKKFGMKTNERRERKKKKKRKEEEEEEWVAATKSPRTTIKDRYEKYFFSQNLDHWSFNKYFLWTK
jgi:hypothetical protein